jgi:hypothetical protein
MYVEVVKSPWTSVWILFNCNNNNNNNNAYRKHI